MKRFSSDCASDKRGAVSDHQPGDGADRLASRGHQVPAQRAFPGRTGERQPAHVASRSVQKAAGNKGDGGGCAGMNDLLKRCHGEQAETADGSSDSWSEGVPASFRLINSRFPPAQARS